MMDDQVDHGRDTPSGPAAQTDRGNDAQAYACSVCGATPAAPTGMADPDLGPVYLCPRHRDRGLDYT